MAFTLATLKSAIDSYTQNDNWGTVDQIDVIIQQTEERINYMVQVQNYNSTVASGTIDVSSPGAGTGLNFISVTDSALAPLAPLYFKMRNGTGTPDDNEWFYLLLKDYNFLQEYAPVDSTTGTPKYYSFYYDASTATPSNDSTFNFAPYVADDGNDWDYEILYYFDPPSLVSQTAGTWLSDHGSSALLYGCLMEAYSFMKGESDLLQLYDARFKEALGTMVTAHAGDYRSRAYQNSPMIFPSAGAPS